MTHFSLASEISELSELNEKLPKSTHKRAELQEERRPRSAPDSTCS